MPTTKQVLVRDLSLDLRNFRTVPQIDELGAVKAMIAIDASKFWGLMESLLDDGYIPAENIIAIKVVQSNIVVVKEGNRRVGVLKIIYGLIPSIQLNLPTHIQTKMDALTRVWKMANKKIPCTVYESSDSTIVDKIVARIHGKAESAGRANWLSVARARHNRDMNGSTEAGLDLLERYLTNGMNINGQQKERFAGDYPLTVLDAAMTKLNSRLGATSSANLATMYPNFLYRDAMEEMLLAIGSSQLRFEHIRAASDFAVQFGFPAIPQPTPPTTPTPPTSPTTPVTPTTSPSQPTPSQPTPTTTPTQPVPTPPIAPVTPTPALPTNTTKSVTNKMNLFIPRGNGREKIVDLRNEILNLKIDKTPIAFCFLLRSLFEISAKVYCAEKGINVTTIRNGHQVDRTLLELLGDATNHLTTNMTNAGMARQLHGAVTQLGQRDGLLSVTSMNQLVHNPAFSIAASDVCTLFHNVYPLLQAMN